MARAAHKTEEEVVHPRPMVHEHDPSRRRWFIVSVVITSLLAVAGWMYFFSGQVAELTKSVPGSLASDSIKNLTNQTKEFGTGAVQDFKATVVPTVGAAVNSLTAKIDQQAKLDGVLDKMTTDLAEEQTADPLTENASPESTEPQQ